MDVQTAPQSPPSPLWRNRDYVILLSGQTVSSLGSSFSQFAGPLLILAVTGSPAQAGIGGFLFSLPYVIFSLPAGALVDRWNRKRVMIICDLGRGLAVGSIPVAWYLFHLTIAQIFIAGAVEGTLFTFFNIAEVAALPRVVSTEQIPEASGQNQAAQIGTMIIGPPLAGLIFQTIGKTIPYLVDAVSYLASVISLSLIKTPFQAERVEGNRDLRAEIMEGLRWLWNQHFVRYMAFLTGGMNFTGAASLLPIIVLARQQHAPASAIGLILTIGSVGGIIGSLVATPIQRRYSFAGVIILTTWVTMLQLSLLAIAPNIVLMGIALAIGFCAGPIYNVVQFGYRLTIIPDELQGRVNSAFRLIAFGFQPVGTALSGFLIQAFGARPTLVFLAAVMTILAVATTFNRHVRAIDRVRKAA